MRRIGESRPRDRYPFKALMRLSLFVISLGASALSAQSSTTRGTTDSLRLYYVGRPVGWEHFSLRRTAGLELTADFDYIDRGRRNHFASAHCARRRLRAASPGGRTRRGHDAHHRDDASTSTGACVGPAEREDEHRRSSGQIAFAISPYTPMSQHLALLRYWKAHGSPASIAVVPGEREHGGDRKRRRRHDRLGPLRVALTRYGIDGVVWGIEVSHGSTTPDRLAMFASAAGGLSFKAVRAELRAVVRRTNDSRGARGDE